MENNKQVDYKLKRELQIKSVKKRNEHFHEKRKKFITESIKTFPFLEEKFNDWKYWLGNGFRFYNLTPIEYYFFHTLKTYNSILMNNTKFINGEINFSKYSSKFHFLKGSINSLTSYYDYLGTTQLKLMKETITEHQNKELMKFPKLPSFLSWIKRFHKKHGEWVY